MNSTTKIIAGVAVFALLFAGIGFALNYTSDTTNSGNEITAAYININDGADIKMLDATKKVPFDTVVDGATGEITQYKLSAGNDIANSAYTVTVVNNGVVTDNTVVTLTFTTENTKLSTYFDMKLNNGTEDLNNESSTAGEFKFTVTLDQEYTIKFLTKAVENVTPEDKEAIITSDIAFAIQAVAVHTDA